MAAPVARPKKSQSVLRLDQAEGATQTIIDRYDENADGIVDNDEFVYRGTYGDELDAEWETEQGWSAKEVFDALEADTRSIVPEAVPGVCADIMEYAVNPNEPWKKVWNSVVLAAVIYSAFEVPFSSAFRPEFEGSNFDYLIDLIFYVDIVLSFFTGFDKGYEIILNKHAIVQHYLRGWFLIDLIATVNWSSVLNALVDLDPASLSWVNKLAMLKILRLARMGRLLDNLTKNFTIHSGFIEAIKFFVYTVVVCHLLGCFFFLVPMLVSDETFSSCAKDELAHEAAKQCILDENNCDEDDPTSFPTSGVGWYWNDACMQGSWREAAGHEEICLPGVCGARTHDNTASVDIVDFDPKKNHKWVWAYDATTGDILTICPTETERSGSIPLELSDEDRTTVLLECLNTAYYGFHQSNPKYTTCNKCRDPRRLYQDSLYWSLTTMTTIGYGDRGPSSEAELWYTLFAEVFGLAFFALLLTQINNVNELLGLKTKAFKQYKDGVLQFMDARQLDRDLVAEAVKFLNFRSSSLSGNSFDDEDPRFDELSQGLRQTIRCAVYLPVLKQIGFFGWDVAAEAEENGVKAFFDNVDTSGDGRLDRDEIRELFRRLQIDLTEEQFNTCFLELDRNGTETVDFVEFNWWWFKTKYGVPRNSSGTKAPLEYLNALAACMQPRPFPINERLVQQGAYGQNFVIVLQGKVRVLRPGVLPGFEGSSADDPDRITTRDRFVEHDDREPMFGFMACLTKMQFDHVRLRTDYWAVDAETYVDTLWCSRRDFYRCFTSHWLKGRVDMVEMSYYHYEVANIIGADSEMDLDSDGVVEHNEFLKASAKLPHGFADHHHRENVKTTAGSLDIARLKSQEKDDLKNTEAEMLDDHEILRQKVQSMTELCATLSADVGILKRGLRAVVTQQRIEWKEERPSKQTDAPNDDRRAVNIDTLDLTALAKRDIVCLAKLLGAQADEYMKKDQLNALIRQQLRMRRDDIDA